MKNSPKGYLSKREQNLGVDSCQETVDCRSVVIGVGLNVHLRGVQGDDFRYADFFGGREKWDLESHAAFLWRYVTKTYHLMFVWKRRFRLEQASN